MRKVLLGTTALAAAGLIAAPAMADDMMAEPITVGISGYTTAAMGFASDGGDNKPAATATTKKGDGIDDTRTHDISYVFEFGISGSTTLDNGINVAVYAQVGTSGQFANEASRPFDEMHATMSGPFGAFRIGKTEDAAFNATVAAPGAGIGGMLGVNNAWFSTAAPTVNTYDSEMFDSDATKVIYTSPNFNGMTIGLSYAPDDTDDYNSGRQIGYDMRDDGSFINMKDGKPIRHHGAHTAVGATYSTTFMEGGSLTLGASYEMAENEVPGDDPSATGFGANITFDQISFGGSMYDYEKGKVVTAQVIHGDNSAVGEVLPGGLTRT